MSPPVSPTALKRVSPYLRRESSQIRTGPAKIREPSSKPTPRSRNVSVCFAASHSNSIWEQCALCAPPTAAAGICRPAPRLQVLHRLVAAEEVEEGAQGLAALAVEAGVAFEDE